MQTLCSQQGSIIAIMTVLFNPDCQSDGTVTDDDNV